MPSPILVTGAAGFAGSHLARSAGRRRRRHRRLASARRHRRRSDAPGDDVAGGRPARSRRAVRQGDRRRPAGRRVPLRRRGARRTSPGTRREPTFATNVRGTHHLLEALRDAGVEARVMIPSSAMVYQPADEPLTEDHPLVPPSPYGLEQARAGAARQRTRVGPPGRHDRRGRSTTSARGRIRCSPPPGSRSRLRRSKPGGREPEVVVGNLDARREVDRRSRHRSRLPGDSRARPVRPRVQRQLRPRGRHRRHPRDAVRPRARADSRSRRSGPVPAQRSCRCSSAIRPGFATSSGGRRRFRSLERWMTCSISGAAFFATPGARLELLTPGGCGPIIGEQNTNLASHGPDATVPPPPIRCSSISAGQSRPRATSPTSSSAAAPRR